MQFYCFTTWYRKVLEVFLTLGMGGSLDVVTSEVLLKRGERGVASKQGPELPGCKGWAFKRHSSGKVTGQEWRASE